MRYCYLLIAAACTLLAVTDDPAWLPPAAIWFWCFRMDRAQ